MAPAAEGRSQRKRGNYRPERVSSSPHQLFHGGVRQSKSERLYGFGRSLVDSAQRVKEIVQLVEEPVKAQLEEESEFLHQLANGIMQETAEAEHAAAVNADGSPKDDGTKKPQDGEGDFGLL